MSAIREILEGSGLVSFFPGYVETAEIIVRFLADAFQSRSDQVKKDFMDDNLACSSTTLALSRVFAENPSEFDIPEKGFVVNRGDLMLAVLKTDTFGMCLEAEHTVADIDVLLASGLIDRLAEYFMPFHGDLLKFTYYSALHFRRFIGLFRYEMPQREQAQGIAERLFGDLQSRARRYEFMAGVARNAALLTSLQLLVWGYANLALINPANVSGRREDHKIILGQMVESLKSFER